MESKPQLLTIKNAASIIGVQYRQLLEAVNSGAVPHYQIGKSRRLVNASEAITAMRKCGGTYE